MNRAQKLSRRDFSALIATLGAVAGVGSAASSTLDPGSARRAALVIGNGRYPQAPLRNAVSDARSVAATLHGLGFQVQRLEDANWPTMIDAFRDFTAAERRSEVRFVFYAGHGLRVHQRNYLNPVGEFPHDEQSLRARSVDVDTIVESFGSMPHGVSVVVVDACRNNPFSSLRRPTRSGTGSGFMPREAPRGTVVAFSTGPNSVAFDAGETEQSPYTRHLLDAMRSPTLPIEGLFKRVHRAVETETRGVQRPWFSTNLTDDFCFRTLQNGRCGEAHS